MERDIDTGIGKHVRILPDGSLKYQEAGKFIIHTAKPNARIDRNYLLEQVLERRDTTS